MIDCCRENLIKKIIFFNFFAFLFFLPLYEAPKNIFNAFFIIFAFLFFMQRKNFSIRLISSVPAYFLYSFLILILGSFLSGLGGDVLSGKQRFFSALNWSLLPLSAIIIILLQPTKADVVTGLRVFLVGTICSILHAFHQWDVGSFPELNSVGHVNQSALYLAFCFFASIFLIVIRACAFNLTLAAATAVGIFWFLSVSLSLTAIAAVGFFTCAFGCAWLSFRKLYAWTAVFLLTVSLVTAVGITSSSEYFGPFEGAKRELDLRFQADVNRFSQRDRLFNSAFELARHSALGWGLGSFGDVVTVDRLKDSVEMRDGNWNAEASRFFISSHGHSLVSNVLVERGWFGLVTFVIFFLANLVRFGVSRSRFESWIGIVTILTILFAGLGQTVLHVEHGQVAFLILAFMQLECWKKTEKNKIFN